MKIITEVRDGKYLLGQLDHPSHYVGWLPARPGRHSFHNNLACPYLPAPEKQVIHSFLIFAGFVNAKEEEKRRQQDITQPQEVLSPSHRPTINMGSCPIWFQKVEVQPIFDVSPTIYL